MKSHGMSIFLLWCDNEWYYSNEAGDEVARAVVVKIMRTSGHRGGRIEKHDTHLQLFSIGIQCSLRIQYYLKTTGSLVHAATKSTDIHKGNKFQFHESHPA